MPEERIREFLTSLYQNLKLPEKQRQEICKELYAHLALPRLFHYGYLLDRDLEDESFTLFLLFGFAVCLWSALYPEIKEKTSMLEYRPDKARREA